MEEMDVTKQDVEDKLRSWFPNSQVVLESGTSLTMPVSGVIVSEEFAGQADLHRTQGVRERLRDAFGSENESQINLELITPEEFQSVEDVDGTAA